MLLFTAHNKSIETGQDLEYLPLDNFYKDILIIYVLVSCLIKSRKKNSAKKKEENKDRELLYNYNVDF